jgi:hypothetical protein
MRYASAMSEFADVEIHGLLKHLQNKPQARQAWDAIQEYRSRALGPMSEGALRREVADQAREEFRSRLLQLLVNGQTVGPAVEYVLGRTETLHNRDRQEREVRQRATDVYTEMFRHELHVLDLDNFPAGQVARIAATNNLALRRLALEDELLTELARIHGEARQRIVRLLEDAQEERW